MISRRWQDVGTENARRDRAVVNMRDAIDSPRPLRILYDHGIHLDDLQLVTIQPQALHSALPSAASTSCATAKLLVNPGELNPQSAINPGRAVSKLM